MGGNDPWKGGGDNMIFLLGILIFVVVAAACLSRYGLLDDLGRLFGLF